MLRALLRLVRINLRRARLNLVIGWLGNLVVGGRLAG